MKLKFENSKTVNLKLSKSKFDNNLVSHVSVFPFYVVLLVQFNHILWIIHIFYGELYFLYV